MHGQSDTEAGGRRPVVRLGLVHRGELVEEQQLTSPREVSLGQGPLNTLVLAAAELPRFCPVLRWQGQRYHLTFSPGQHGRIRLADGTRSFSQLRDRGATRGADDWWHLPLPADAMGKLTVGEVTLLFQLQSTSAAAKPVATPKWLRASLGGQVDSGIATSLTSCAAVALVVWVALHLIPKPAAPERPTKLWRPVTARLGPPKPPKPAPDRQAPAVGQATDGSATAVAAAPPRPSAGRRKRSGRSRRSTTNSGPAAAGSAAHRRALGQLTGLDPRLLKVIPIGAACQGADCERAVVGDPNLRGRSAGDLDERANGAGGIGPDALSLLGGLRRRRGPLASGDPGGLSVMAVRPAPDLGRPRAMAPRKRPPTIGVMLPPLPPIPPNVGRKLSARVRQYIYRLKHCYQRLLINRPKLTGSLRLSFTVMPHGRVSGVNMQTNLGALMTACVRQRLARWYLGKLPQAVFYGPVHLRFRPGG